MKEELRIGLLSAQIEVQQYKLTLLREEIDDNVSQLLSSIKMLLGITGRNVYPMSDIVKTAQGTLTMAIQELHSLCNSLNNYCLDSFNLIETLKVEVERLNYWKKAHITFTISTSLPIMQHEQLILFIIIIEIIKSSIEHSNKKDIIVDLYKEQLEIKIKNHKVSFSKQQLPWKSIRKIEYYIQLIGGKILWPSGAKQESEIHILLPVYY